LYQYNNNFVVGGLLRVHSDKLQSKVRHISAVIFWISGFLVKNFQFKIYYQKQLKQIKQIKAQEKKCIHLSKPDFLGGLA